METIRKIFDLLDRQEKIQAGGLMVLFLLLSLTEVAGIASLLPFMSVLANPETIQQNKWLSSVYNFFGFDNPTDFMFLLGLGVFLILVISNVIKAATRWTTLIVTQSWGESLAIRLFEVCLRQPYDFFLKRNSSDLAKNILAEVHAVTSNVILAFLDMVTKIIVSVVILIFLAVMEPGLAIGTAIILGGSYITVFMIFKKSLKAEAHRRSLAQTGKYKVVNEGIQGIKNIKLGGHERLYLNYFSAPAKNFAISSAKSNVMGEIPRFAMEIIAFGGVLLILLYLLMHSSQSLSQALPIVAVYVFAGYRLLPGLQGIYYGFTKLRFNGPILDTIREELSHAATMQQTSPPVINPLPFIHSIKAENLSFRYENGREIINEASFEIKAHSMVGIIGKTGAGKTTLVDLILGLLPATSGKILIDGADLTPDNIHEWQKNLSYVSQHIYLCDDTIAANIAFGVSPENIDIERLKYAASQASLSQFIERELAQGYDTIVGENGIRLSGGQRQRIGLARALYLNRPVLVLDEATSALDPHTEEEVMTSIHRLDQKKTILIISHKMDLLSKCDEIFIVENGNVTSQNKANLSGDLRNIHLENAHV